MRCWRVPAYRGRINGIWTSIKATADSDTLSPEITSLIAKVEQDYSSDMEKLSDSIRKASKASEPYPVTVDEWFAKATAVINSIVTLGHKAGQFARSKSEKLKKAVERMMGKMLLAQT